MVSKGVLTGDLSGSVVVKLTDLAWEVWILGGDSLPTSLEDMLRYIAMTDPPADGMALVQLAIKPGDSPPRPGLEVVAERAGQLAEYWCELDAPNGPAGARIVKQVRQRAPRAVPEGGMWIGVDPMVTFQLGPLGIIEG
jgi:hypothetical protein